jgi:hypothetical protein
MLRSTSFRSFTASIPVSVSMLPYLLLSLFASHCAAEPIPVKSPQAAVHTFLVLRTQEGKAAAVGEMTQTVKMARVTTRVKFRFDDGSEYEETTVFSQHGVFQVLSDHLLQTGPSFKDPMEVWIDCPTGEVRVRDMKPARNENDDKGGKDNKNNKNNVTTAHMKIPADLANGILPVIMEDFPDEAEHTVTMLAATPKPRIVKLVLSPQGEDTFLISKTKYKAARYVGKIKIGGVTGAVASLAGKEPPDSEFWVLKGSAPAFLKSSGPLSADNTVWQIELATPTWPGVAAK